MRRIVVTFSSAALLIGLAACGDSGGGGKVPSDGTTATPDGSDATTTSNNDTTTTTTPNDTSTTTSNPDTTTSNPDTSTPQDTSVEPDTSGGDGHDLCPGILQCVSDDCGSATTQEQFNTCVQNCAADSDQLETQAFSAYVTCEADCIPEDISNPPTGEQEKGIYECLLDNCVEANTSCQAGPDFGTKTCLQLNACLTACGADGTIPCLRACYAESTEEAGQTFTSLSYCIFSQCADKVGAEFNNCATTAQQNPPCVTYANQCRGIAGGAGAGAGGAGGSGAFEFAPQQFQAFQRGAHR